MSYIRARLSELVDYRGKVVTREEAWQAMEREGREPEEVDAYFWESPVLDNKERETK